ncbi:MAG TPA: VWA domain-containing protein [Vicinamibacterales bacterium]|nr:VWA domain-containing protein [Vicinamibacterales bacterium]
MLRPVRTAVAWGVTALGIAVAFALPAAQGPANPQPFQTEVNYVRVDVHPTADGKPLADLAAEDFEVLEDGAPQKIAQFEYVRIGGPRPQTAAPEPSTLAGMRRAAQDPRTRLFALFVDPRFVTLLSSMQVRKPLVDAFNRLVGGEDLIAVMTPEMSPEALTFTRRTSSIETLLAGWWGEKGWAGLADPIEFKYEACYPEMGDTAGIAAEMMRRRREKQTLDALESLATYLTNLREERKAVIVVSEGWPLYGPNSQLARPVKNRGSGVRPVTIDPRTGKPTAAEQDPFAPDYQLCETHRQAFSQLQDEDRFLAIMQSANRGNVSFYPIDPRGLTTDKQPGVNALRTMAEMTDGLAITEQNIATGLQRVVDDLSSYYLLGYYSPAKPDGKYHRISVRVKRPGVQVRARAGYLAAKAPTVTRSTAPAAPAAPVSDADAAEAHLVSDAIGGLSAYARERPIRLQAASGWMAGTPGVWAVAEVPRMIGGDDWSKGGSAEVRLVDETGATIATQEVALPASAGPISARVFLKPAVPLTPGEYQIRVRATTTGALPATEMLRIRVALPPASSGALFNRRNVSTGNREAATADLRFRRTERIVVLVPASSTAAVTARLLDRTGKPMAIPVTAAIRDEADGSHWRAAELALAPLAPGDYLIELSAEGERTLSAVRVLP